MVAVIKTSQSIHRIFNYNENKVKEGVARCIGEGNYPVDVEGLSLSMKLNLLLKRMELNPNVKTNSVHISLNFDPSESGLGEEKLMAIAHTYMEKIGFKEQPYLVYQHFDAGHPHIHLISTNIRPDGSRIDLHNIGRNQSEKARKEIEKSFGLVEAEGRGNQQVYKPEPIAMGVVRYGKIQSKKALTNVLNAVLSSYKYTSLPELNAVLGLYNVMADHGSEKSKIFKGGGLVYRILDGQGKPTGVPIKASDFYSKPTLKFLEKQFEINRGKRMPNKRKIRNEVDMEFVGGKRPTLDQLRNTLQKQGIDTVLRKSDTEMVYGITYVDHATKSVFNGSALGKPYSAKAIQERCLSLSTPEPNSLTHSVPEQMGLPPRAITTAAETKTAVNEPQQPSGPSADTTLLETLLKTEYTSDYLPHQLKRKKKRKKKGRNPGQNNP